MTIYMKDGGGEYIWVIIENYFVSCRLVAVADTTNKF